MKIFIRILIVLIAAGVVAFLFVNESKPTGSPGSEAEALTDKMWKAIGKKSWDSLHYVAWSFRDDHHYLWDRKGERAEVAWDEFKVQIDLVEMNFLASEGDKTLEGEAYEAAKEKAWNYWCNDSFWLNAPAKARDAGTTRSVVKTDRGDGLMVTYASGGVTPGDAYLWILDENGLPIAYKMWVKIIPIGGLEATWSNWTDVNGAKLAAMHEIGGLEVAITNIRGGEGPDAIGIDEAYFSKLP